MPKLKVMDSDALNAFATGLNERQYSITVTTGLLKALDDDEIEAVLGHELTHIRNGDVQMMVIAVIIAGVVGFFGELFFRMFFNSWNSGSGWSSSRRHRRRPRPTRQQGRRRRDLAIIIAVALIAARLAAVAGGRLALSRSREFLADAGSVELTKNPDAMISALRKIENRGELAGRDLGGDGNVHRQSARGLCRSVRHPPLGRGPRRRAGEIRRRPRSRAAGPAVG